MAEVDNNLIFEVLKRVQTDMAKGFADTNARMDRFEQHLSDLERRQTATTHFEQSVLAHLASIHGSMDELKADMRAVRSEMREVHGRLDRVEAR